MIGLKVKLLFISSLLVVYIWRFNSVIRQLPQIEPGTRVKVTARVSQQPSHNISYQILTLGQFVVKTGHIPGYDYGQKLQVIGKPTKRLTNKYNFQFIFDYPSIRVLPESESLINQTRFRRWLFHIRGYLEERIYKALPVIPAGLLNGMLLGSKDKLPPEYTHKMRDIGTIHILVASGYNLTVISGILMSLLLKAISRKKAIALVLAVIWAYALMLNLGAPIVRAAIMTSLSLLAVIFGRDKDVVWGLLLTAVIMLLVSPLILYDIGFQLSFLATAGIIVISPKISGRLFKIPVVGEGLRTTLAAQLAVLPVLLINFGQFNYFSPLINALVLPVVPVAMALGSLIWLTPMAAWLVKLPLNYLISVMDWFDRLDFGRFWLGGIPFWLPLVYYLILLIWISEPKSA